MSLAPFSPTQVQSSVKAVWEDAFVTQAVQKNKKEV